MLSRNFSRHWFDSLRRAGVDLLFPPTCVACHHAGFHLCPACAQQVEPVPSPICFTCGRSQQFPTECCRECQRILDRPLTIARSASLYTFPLNDAIRSLKFSRNLELAVPLARYLIATYRSELMPSAPVPIDVVVPVPIHATRLAERGYNQAERLAAAFCRVVNLPLQPGWLARTRFMRSQVGLTQNERRANVAGAFIAPATVPGAHILLIDDVYSTGATLNACAEVLLNAGARLVSALTLAQPRRAGDDLVQ